MAVSKSVIGVYYNVRVRAQKRKLDELEQKVMGLEQRMREHGLQLPPSPTAAPTDDAKCVGTISEQIERANERLERRLDEIEQVIEQATQSLSTPVGA